MGNQKKKVDIFFSLDQSRIWISSSTKRIRKKRIRITELNFYIIKAFAFFWSKNSSLKTLWKVFECTVQNPFQVVELGVDVTPHPLAHIELHKSIFGRGRKLY